MKRFLLLKYIFVISFFVILFYIFYLNYFDINKNIEKLSYYLNNNQFNKIESNIKKLKRIDYLPDGNTLLTFAVKNSNIELVKLFIENGFNPNLKDKNNISPLEYSWKINNKEIISLLLKNGAFLSDILLFIENITNEEEKKSEYFKLEHYFEKELLTNSLMNEYETLYKSNESFIKKNDYLFILYRNYGDEIFKNSIFSKLNNDEIIKLKDLNKRLMVISNYIYKYLNIIKFMANKDWFNIKNCLDKEKYSKYILSFLLRVSMNLDLVNSFEYLLLLGADPSLIGFGDDGIDTYRGFIHPIFISIHKNNIFYFRKIYSIVNIDTIKFPYINPENSEVNFIYPIDLCLEKRFNEGLFYIINIDKNKINYINNKGESLLISAIKSENYDLVYFLLKNNSNINFKVNYDNYNRDLLPLHFAIIQNSLNMVKLITEEHRKRDPNFPEIKAICMYQGTTFTSLSLSSYLNYSEIFKYLLYLNIDNCLGLFDSIQYAFKNENYNLIRNIFLAGYFNSKLKYDEQQFFIEIAKKLNKEYLFVVPKEEENN
ncbi:MAG: ankyrin repeat domain-containing protein [Spirochaetes bacterium]|nr:ankyrin repeat domain-containing protein [Spirochaetota bacterium]